MRLGFVEAALRALPTAVESGPRVALQAMPRRRMAGLGWRALERPLTPNLVDIVPHRPSASGRPYGPYYCVIIFADGSSLS